MNDMSKKNKSKRKVIKIFIGILVVVLLNVLFFLRIGIIRIPEDYWINYFKNNKERFVQVVTFIEEKSDNHSFKVSYLEPKQIVETGNKSIFHLLFFAGFKRISDETDYKYTLGSYSDCLKVKFYISNLRIEDNDLMAIVYSEEEILLDYDEGDNVIHYEKIDDNWYLQYK